MCAMSTADRAAAPRAAAPRAAAPRAAGYRPGPVRAERDPGQAEPVRAAAARRPGVRQPGVRPSQVPVSQPEDAAEHAADALADRIAPKPAVFGGAERSPMPVAPSAVWAAIDLPGRPLAGHERPPGLGADLSPVRIHAGRRAADSARMLGAAAYTFGEDVVLGDGVDTRSAAGRRILAHELAHVVQQRSSPSPVIRRQGNPKTRPSAGPAAAGPAAENLGTKTERVWQSLLAFDKRAPAAVHVTLVAVQDYIAHYDRAFASFKARLAEGEREKAASEKWRDVMWTIAIGAALGVGAASLLEACKSLKHAVEASQLLELGFETAVHSADAAADAGVGQLREAASSEGPEFKAPHELEADYVARGYWEQVAKVSDVVSLTGSAVSDLSPVRDGLRAGYPAGKSAQISAWLNHVADAIAAADRSVTLFRTAVDTPLLLRTDDQISQDLWIRWMAESAANAEWAGPRQPGLNRRLVPGKWQEKELVDLARDEVERLNLIGRLGVVMVPPRATPRGESDYFYPGVVRLRHDAYQAAGRLEPKQPEPETLPGIMSQAAGGDEPFVEIAWEDQTYLRTGEVVLIYGTSARGVLAHRFGRGPMSLTVSKNERTWAFGMLGIEQPEYFHPEATQRLYTAVLAAANEYQLPYVSGTAGSDISTARLEVIETEDGVMVVDRGLAGPPGRPIALFAPLASERTESDLQVAQERRKRTGVSKVIAIDLRYDPNRMDRQQEIREPGVVLISLQDVDLRKELRDVVPQGPPAIRR
jgi:hypothetical protein